MTKENRYRTLDSLRGILSLTVVLGHCFNSITALSWVYEQSSAPPAHNIFFFLAYSPLHFLVNGQKAVILFFVLSGFVLSIPFYKKDITKSQYFIFFIKRILRLYLPCLGIIVIAILVKLTYYNPGATIAYGETIKGFLGDTISPNQLLKSFLLRGPETNFVPVLWTLSIEIKLSLIIPFFVYVLRRLNVKWSVSIIGAIIIFNMIIKRVGVYSFFPDATAFYYMTFFIMGSIICKYKLDIISWIDSLNNIYFFSLLALSLCFYSYNYVMWWVPMPSRLSALLLKSHDYFGGTAGVLLLIFALSEKLKKPLEHIFTIFIGKISFSLYLIHHIVILSCVYLLGKFINQYLVIGTGLILSVPFAFLFYKFIELPAVQFAGIFSKRLFHLMKNGYLAAKINSVAKP